MSACAIPSGQPVQQHQSPLEVLAAEIGAVAGQIERESSLRIAAVIADLQRGEADRELRFSKLERLIEDRVASLKDGAPGEPGPQGPEGPQGPQGDRGEPGPQGRDFRAEEPAEELASLIDTVARIRSTIEADGA